MQTSVPVDPVTLLREIRTNVGPIDTPGLSDDEIASFLESDPLLASAIEEAHQRFQMMAQEYPDLYLGSNEKTLIEELQSGFVNFYNPATVNPYVALGARGPWVITSHGAVVHDNGGYGMLGAGHGPERVIQSMSDNWVMANVMTASFSQKRLDERLRRELGHTRGWCPFEKFICMNSGSESVTVSLRIADVNAKIMTQSGGKHEGKSIKMMAIEQGFHGRTDRPAQMSHSCKGKYDQYLASFQNRDNLILVPANDVAALEQAFDQAAKENVFIELLAIEPVQGEGNPGQCVSREFYDAARRLTLEHDSMLLVDSIQAGIRGQGTLSVVDYQGFEDSDAPDLETWSKAMNAGQYPLSVLGMNKRASDLYVTGIYGNTMTTNPRALETAVAVLDGITPELRTNIRERGVEFVEKFSALQEEFPHVITKVQGTGLLCSAELEPNQFPVVGMEAVEPWCRRRGLGVIHGGQNALRFTPHFNITSKEIDLIVGIVREALVAFGA
ncbi:MAG TPA: aminotransferase class III-fold pyridoxal phosphate-dependent enzyme [Candidatus Poseidoniales archaeon]|nr:MAG TPA: aminotransferase class III-fold pyridoxal phosphate-dependent enzyme [Candidatus Poseidoniales archaeon]HII20549.1 aminotransferase class III-fold pyridoxal phosphate-dependent enzyme [Poseidonia sp.]